MSQKFYVVVISLLVTFGAVMTFVVYAQGDIIDGMLKCLVSAGTWA